MSGDASSGGGVDGKGVLEVSDLAGGYGGESAIADVNFVLPRGQLMCVLGPNGGGKTTLFKALLDELPERSGRIELGGAIAYVPQTERARLDFPVSAIDVVLMGTYSELAWYQRIGHRQRKAADAALERVGLADRSDDGFGRLSGGQRQRVLIARALARDAAILLLDEPLSGVDAVSAERILLVLDELRREGSAVVVATHDIDHARKADSVLCINGRQVAFGSPESALSGECLRRTYGHELVVLPGGNEAILVDHHAH